MDGVVSLDQLSLENVVKPVCGIYMRSNVILWKDSKTRKAVREETTTKRVSGGGLNIALLFSSLGLDWFFLLAKTLKFRPECRSSKVICSQKPL